jgi:hypothetical protein
VSHARRPFGPRSAVGESEQTAHWRRETLGELYRRVQDLGELETAETYEVITAA